MGSLEKGLQIFLLEVFLLCCFWVTVDIPLPQARDRDLSNLSLPFNKEAKSL